jgi:hypothetical protein
MQNLKKNGDVLLIFAILVSIVLTLVCNKIVSIRFFNFLKTLKWNPSQYPYKLFIQLRLHIEKADSVHNVSVFYSGGVQIESRAGQLS